MKHIKLDLPTGNVIFSPDWTEDSIRERAVVHVGCRPTDEICMVNLPTERDWRIDRFAESGRTCIELGFHRAWIVLPRKTDLSLPSTIKPSVWRKEAVLSILPVVTFALMLHRRCHAKADYGVDDLFADADEFNGLLPFVVAAAARPLPIRTYKMPSAENGILTSVARTLAIDVHTKQVES